MAIDTATAMPDTPAMIRDEYDDRAWDALCHQCGLCCFEKLEDPYGRIIYTRIPCRYLDIETRQCRIYPRRLEINPKCIKLTPTLLPTLRWLPAECGYKGELPELPKKDPRRRRRR